MSMSTLTAIIIQQGGDDIQCSAAGPHPASGKYSGWISLWRNSRPHISPLISTPYEHDDRESAIETVQRIVECVRSGGDCGETSSF